MTAADREYLKQERLVMHSLQVFLHLQDVQFEDPRVYYQGMADLIDHTVRCIAS